VRQEPGFDLKWADREWSSCAELAKRVRVLEHAGAIEGKNLADRVGQRVDRERGCRVVSEGSGPQQRVEIRAVVGMAVADKNAIDILRPDISSKRGRIA
jgi:hypothetical protein